MANYPTESYANLEKRFQALIGIESLQSVDRLFFRDLINRRFRMGYERFPWPHFTVVGETVNITDRSIVTYDVANYSTNCLANNANVVFRIHSENPESNQMASEYTFIAETNSAGAPTVRIIDQSFKIGEVFVSYRRDIIDEINRYGSTTGFFGNEEGDNGDIPWVLFEYVTHSSYADYLRSEGQNSKAIQEDQIAEQLLVAEMEKVREQGRQFRHDVLQFRPPSQFRRHNISAGGAPVGQVQQNLSNEIQ